MNNLINLWDFLGRNASQLQLILSCLAIFLGVKAAFYAKHQLDIANQQRQDNIRLSEYNLKLSLLERALNCQVEIKKFRYEHKKYQQEFSKLLKTKNLSLDDTFPGYDYSFRTWLNFANELLESPEKANQEIIDALTNENKPNLGLEELQKYLILLLKYAASIEASNKGLERRIEEIKNLFLL